MRTWKTETSLLKTGADGVWLKINIRVITDENNPTAHFSLSKEWRTAMMKLVQAMALLCSTYNLDLNNFMVEHELLVVVILNKNSSFLLGSERGACDLCSARLS